jgi:hypothetical protein
VREDTVDGKLIAHGQTWEAPHIPRVGEGKCVSPTSALLLHLLVALSHVCLLLGCGDVRETHPTLPALFALIYFSS